MKNMKKILALVVAALMIMSSFAALAADPAPATPSGALTIDTSVTVTNLDNGDSVKFVKMVKWVDGTGWAWDTDFAEKLATVVTAEADRNSLFAHVTGQNVGTEQYVPGAISAADGATLAKAAALLTGESISATGNETDGYKATLELANAATADDTAKMGFVGLYCALVTPAKADTMYNPVFIGADFGKQGSSPETINSQSATTELSYDPVALAKKETITLTKEITGEGNGTAYPTGNTKYDLDVGDDVQFTITTWIPAYSAAYQNPHWTLTDTMEAGLVFKEINSVTVEDFTGDAAWAKGTEYNVTPAAPTSTFTIDVTADGLGKVTAKGAAKKITVVYTATIKSLENANVTEKDNEAVVNFSNNPGDSGSYSLLEDRTRNYTFSIDANLLGNDQWENSELVKVGMTPDGQEILDKVNLSNGGTAGALQGAEFGLYTALTGDGKDVDTSKPYSNTVDGTAVSYASFLTDENGKMHINGLDAGTYYLKEIKAPAGYIKSTDIYKIEIDATYEQIEGGTYIKKIEGEDILVKYDAYEVLKSYTVKVTNLSVENSTAVTSTFTITNTGDGIPDYDQKAQSASETDVTTKIANTQGTELPSTGGMGTTLLYIGGSVLVILAAVLLITKRRMSAND